ncbi:MAG: hypothetical protein ACI8Y4_002805 [Candidatus Poriferisodalaceae bacterium]|jgi:hypothetical protein
MANGVGFDREGADSSNDAALGLLAGSDRSRVDLARSLVEVADNATFTADGATSLTGWLRRRGEMTALEAGRTSRRVNVVRRLPRFADLLVQAAPGTQVDAYVHVCQHFASLANEHLSEPTAPRSAGTLSFISTLFAEAELNGRLTTDQATVVGEAFGQLWDPDPADAQVRRSLTERRADALADLADHLTCDASIGRLIVDPVGNPLNLGRSTAGVSPS